MRDHTRNIHIELKHSTRDNTCATMIYEFHPSYCNTITAPVVRHIKTWLNIHRYVITIYHFLPIPGAGLAHITSDLNVMYVVQHMLFIYSADVHSNHIAHNTLIITT